MMHGQTKIKSKSLNLIRNRPAWVPIADGRTDIQTDRQTDIQVAC